MLRKCKQGSKTRQSRSIDFGQWQGAAKLFWETNVSSVNTQHPPRSKPSPTQFQQANRKCIEEMRDTTVTLQGEKCKFLAFPARQFQGRAATAWRKDCRVKERRVKKKRKTDGERMERIGKWHYSWEAETRGKCTQLQIVSIQKQQGICTGKVRDKKCQRAEFSLAQPPSIISNSMFPYSACKGGRALLRPHTFLRRYAFMCYFSLWRCLSLYYRFQTVLQSGWFERLLEKL